MRRPPLSLVALCTLGACAATCAAEPVLAPQPTVAQESGKRTLVVEDTGFPVRRFDVQGKQPFTAAQLNAVVGTYLGEQRTIIDLRAAANALQSAYQKAGLQLTLVSLPEQDVVDGVVVLKVLSGKIGKVEVVGNKKLSEKSIRASLPLLVEGAAPNLGRLDAAVRLANEIPSRSVALNFRPGDDTGEVLAQVRVQEAPLDRYSFALDNTGNTSSGRDRLAVSYQRANLFDLDHVASLQYVLAPDKLDAVSIIGLGYRIPFYAQNMILDLVGAYSNVDTNTSLNTGTALSMTGKGGVLGAQASYLLPTLRGAEQRLTLSLYRRDYANQCSGSGAGVCGSTASGIADVTVQPLAIGYSAGLSLPGLYATSALNLSTNLPVGANSGKSDFTAAAAATHTEASNHFNVLHVNAQVQALLPRDWQFNVRTAGQYTNSALVPAEQFGLGGAQSLRGYEERIASDDKGLSLNLEFLSPAVSYQESRTRALVFFDRGWLWRNEALPGYTSQPALASLGAGLRSQVGPHWSLNLDLGHVLETAGNDLAHSNRLHFSLNGSY